MYNVHWDCSNVCNVRSSCTYMCVILCAVIEFLPAELKARLSQIQEQDEDLQSREISTCICTCMCKRYNGGHIHEDKVVHQVQTMSASFSSEF